MPNNNLEKKCEHDSWENLHNGFWECNDCLIIAETPMPRSRMEPSQPSSVPVEKHESNCVTNRCGTCSCDCSPSHHEASHKQCDCPTKYCKHYESDFDRFVASPKVEEKVECHCGKGVDCPKYPEGISTSKLHLEDIGYYIQMQNLLDIAEGKKPIESWNGIMSKAGFLLEEHIQSLLLQKDEQRKKEVEEIQQHWFNLGADQMRDLYMEGEEKRKIAEQQRILAIIDGKENDYDSLNSEWHEGFEKAREVFKSAILLTK